MLTKWCQYSTVVRKSVLENIEGQSLFSVIKLILFVFTSFSHRLSHETFSASTRNVNRVNKCTW